MSQRLSSPRFARRVTWVAGFIFLAGVVAITVVLIGGRDDEPLRSAATPAAAAPIPAETKQTGGAVAVAAAAKAVAADFILSAVTREDLPKAWKITDPASDLRLCGGVRCTYREWLAGDIPVQPFPPDQLGGVTYKVDESRADRVVLEVVLLPKKGAKIQQQIFFIGLKAVGNGKSKRWLVDYWAPRAVIPVPVIAN
jgi:hypothetical protein